MTTQEDAMYQYGLREIDTDRIFSLPTDDQGIKPEIVSEGELDEMYGGTYEVMVREVGPWKSAKKKD